MFKGKVNYKATELHAIKMQLIITKIGLKGYKAKVHTCLELRKKE